MSEEAYGVTVAKRRLSRRLAALRMAKGFSAAQVCDKLDWGRGKVNRFESNDWKLPEMSDVRDLLRLYGVDEDEQDVLLDLARKGRVRAWWRKYDEVFDNEFPGYEADAARISVYTPLVLPGLLQTPAYIEAYLGAGSQTATWRLARPGSARAPAEDSRSSRRHRAAAQRGGHRGVSPLPLGQPGRSPRATVASG